MTLFDLNDLSSSVGGVLIDAEAVRVGDRYNIGPYWYLVLTAEHRTDSEGTPYVTLRVIPADDPRHAKRAPVALAFRTNEKVRIR